IALLFDLIFTLTELTVVYVLTGGGPVDQTQVLANYALQVGVNGGALGQGAAIALSLLPGLPILTLGSLRSLARREGLWSVQSRGGLRRAAAGRSAAASAARSLARWRWRSTWS